jgi:hypothetical protein
MPLATAMRRLLTGYAGDFNRRHKRIGRLFQNRYKSILVEEEPYLLELVRYVHLNPLRAGLVQSLEQLDRYPWTGHSALMGRVARPWQAVREVLGQFGSRRGTSRQRYRDYLTAGIALGHRPELQGGGLRRSAGGWAAVQVLRRGREHGAADERILGSGAFVEAVYRTVAGREPVSRAVAGAALPGLIARCARSCGVTPTEIAVGSRRRMVARARAVASYLAVRELGLPMTDIARHLGVTPAAVQLGLQRGAALLATRGQNIKDLLPKNR